MANANGARPQDQKRKKEKKKSLQGSEITLKLAGQSWEAGDDDELGACGPEDHTGAGVRKKQAGNQSYSKHFIGSRRPSMRSQAVKLAAELSLTFCLKWCGSG